MGASDIIPMEAQMLNADQNRFERFYLNEKHADFHFLFKIADDKYESVPAHKILLEVSDVFQAWFNGDWKDKTKVEIVDAAAVDFKEFLRYFYMN